MTPTQTILVVDDEQNNLDLIQRYVKRAGYETKGAVDGVSALDLAIDSPPDLIILDWMMPDLSGIDVLRAIREHHDANDLPIIMCTALDEADYVVAAMAEGANDFVSKPVNPVILKARISSQLERKAAVADLGAFNTRLESLVAERTRELTRLSGAAQSSPELSQQDRAQLVELLGAVAAGNPTLLSNPVMRETASRILTNLTKQSPTQEEARAV